MLRFLNKLIGSGLNCISDASKFDTRKRSKSKPYWLKFVWLFH